MKLLVKNSSERYLLIQRSDPLPDGTGIKWDIPGGQINSSERLEEALIREVWEEIGINLNSPVGLLQAQDVMLSDIDLHIVRLTYITELEEKITLGKEHQKSKWVTQEEALALSIDSYLYSVLTSL